MTDRLELDEEKLRESVGIFRTNANLHNSSSDEALIRYAHEGGKGRPHAKMVREKWHDFENGRRYATLPVTPYQITYQTQEPLFGPDDPKQGEGAGESDALGITDDPAPSCLHIDMVLDETGRENVCADCGELLGPADPNPKRSQGSEPHHREGADSSKQPKRDDDEEVLF